MIAGLGLTTLPQKLLLGGLGAALLAAGTFNVVQAVENHQLAEQNRKLDTSINDPQAGYIVRLTQARTNSETCVAAVKQQTIKIKALSSRDTAAIAAVQVAYDAEHVARIRAEKAAAAILAHRPQGNTVAERVTDVDAQILGDLK